VRPINPTLSTPPPLSLSLRTAQKLCDLVKRHVCVRERKRARETERTRENEREREGERRIGWV